MQTLHAPRRHDQDSAVSAQFLLLFGLAVMDTAAVAVVMQGGMQGGGIWDQSTFRMCCLIGASGGALLSIWIWPDSSGSDKQTLRAIAKKLGSSAIGGWAFTPTLMRALSLPLDVDTVIGASCATAFASVATLQMLAALYRKYAPRWLEAKAVAITGPLTGHGTESGDDEPKRTE